MPEARVLEDAISKPGGGRNQLVRCLSAYLLHSHDFSKQSAKQIGHELTGVACDKTFQESRGEPN